MPYKSEKIHIAGSEHDRRCKLTDGIKDKIIALRGLISAHKCALEFNVSRRTVQFLWYPERLETNKQRRQERGGSKQYYDRVKNTEYQRNHRRYKQELYIKGEIG